LCSRVTADRTNSGTLGQSTANCSIAVSRRRSTRDDPILNIGAVLYAAREQLLAGRKLLRITDARPAPIPPD
jgi:hypothetical protein